MSDEIFNLTTKFEQQLREFGEQRQQLDTLIRQLLQALAQKKIPRDDAYIKEALADLYTSEDALVQTSRSVTHLLEQSFKLSQTSDLVFTSLNPSQVVETAMDTIVELTLADRAYLMLRDPTTKQMEVVAARNWERETLSDAEVIFSRSIIEMAMEQKHAIISENASRDNRFDAATSVLMNRLRSVLCIPLILKEEVIGVLYADNPVQKGIFQEYQIPVLSAFAHQTAIAIENARLYQTLERVNRQLNEANRLKSEFLGVVSHELRSPFSAIGFALEAFPRYGMDNLTLEQRELWEDLTKGIKQAQQQANNLVNYAGLFSRQGQLKLEPVDINALIAETVQTAQPMAERRDISISTKVAKDLRLPAGDVDRLGEAIWHLVQNAIQYNKPKGKIIIRAGIVREHLAIEVEDTGIGIKPEHQERIWEAFEQITDSLKRGVEGLGLGLALVRYVAMAHGGAVRLKSTPDVGSTFGIMLPLSATRLSE